MLKRKYLPLLVSLLLTTGLSWNVQAGPVCGDGVVEGDEECDRGGDSPDNLCTNNFDQGNGPCTDTFCGDDVTQSPNADGFNEECDGEANCSNSCSIVTTTTTTTSTTTTTGGTTTSTTGATTTSTTGGTTSTTGGTTTSTTGATTTSTTGGTTTSTTGATTSTTMGTGPTTTTTTTAASTTTTAATTTTTTLPPEGEDKVEDVPIGDSGETVTISNDSGETISNVSTGQATGGPGDVVFPFGTISYTTTSPVGGDVTMRFKFSSDLPDNLVIYKIDKKGNYKKLPKDIWKKINSRTVEITVTDGDKLTDQGPEDGEIIDPVAVGSDTSDNFDFGGSGGCTLSSAPASASFDPIWLLLLAVPGAGLMRRRLAASRCQR